MLKYIFLLFLFISCDEFTEKNLYGPSDPEYPILLQMEADKCVSEASVFNLLDEMGDFENAGFNGDIYKITQDANNDATLFMYISSVSASSITVKVAASDSGLNKEIIFEKSDHEDIMEQIKIMACSSQYKEHFSAGGLSSSILNIKWSKESIVNGNEDSDGDYIGYDRREENHIFNSEYPLFFFYYNGSKNRKNRSTAGGKITDKTSNLTINRISTDDCNSETLCEDLIDGTLSITRTCNIDVVKDLYKTSSYNDQLIVTNDAGCTLLQSAQ